MNTATSSAHLNRDCLSVEHTHISSNTCAYKYEQVYDIVNTVQENINLYLEENVAFWAYRWYPTVSNAYPADSAWGSGKDSVSPTRTAAHLNYGQPVQQSPLHPA